MSMIDNTNEDVKQLLKDIMVVIEKSKLIKECKENIEQIIFLPIKKEIINNEYINKRI